MLLEDKVQLKVRISRSLDERFRKLVAEKHGQYKHGILSFEAETALNQYIATYHIQQQSTKLALQQEEQALRSNPIPKVWQLKQEIFKYFIDSGNYLEVPQFIVDKQLHEAIGQIRGMDERTVRKWVGLLKKYGCIKQSGMHQFEFV